MTDRYWLKPTWRDIKRVHDWRNHISEDMAREWDTFTDRQKMLIAENAKKAADREEWE